jgi:hypothetical protein
VSTILYYYSKELGFDFKLKDFNLPRFELIYPINLKDLRDRIYRFRALHYYQRENFDPKAIAQMVEEAFNRDIEIPELNVRGGFPPFEELFKDVNTLLKKGHSKLESHHLPYPDKSITEAETFYRLNVKENFRKVRSVQYSEAQARLYIETFFKHLDSCYKEFVENFFPTFKNEFSFYTSIPHEYFFFMKDSDALKWGHFGYYSSVDGKAKVNIQEFRSSDEIFKEGKIKILRGFSLDNILYNDFPFEVKTVDGINTSKVDDFCVIRGWVYRFLKDDIRDLFEANEISI